MHTLKGSDSFCNCEMSDAQVFIPRQCCDLLLTEMLRKAQQSWPRASHQSSKKSMTWSSCSSRHRLTCSGVTARDVQYFNTLKWITKRGKWCQRQERWPLFMKITMHVMQSRACRALRVAGLQNIQDSVLTASILYMLGVDKGPAVQIVIHKSSSCREDPGWSLLFPLLVVKLTLYTLKLLSH